MLKQFPVVPPNTYREPDPWSTIETRCFWLLPRVLELTFTAWDLAPFAHDCGYDGAPFRWDEARRLLLRCELDAAFFHLYGVNRDDTDYIMETFPVVKKKDIQQHGDYRTKLTILEIYDAMQWAIETGEPYQTRWILPRVIPALPIHRERATNHEERESSHRQRRSEILSSKNRHGSRGYWCQFFLLKKELTQ